MKPHYLRIRRVKTHSKSIAIQVGRYKGKRFELSKHIGSARDEKKVNELISIANEYIKSQDPQLELNFEPQSEEILFKRGIEIKSSYLEEAYNYLSRIYNIIGFHKIDNTILKHFVMIRVLESASKIRSIMLLNKYFGIGYKKTTVFRELSKTVNKKEQAITIAIEYAKENLGFAFTLVFYDVTTLYFETDIEDDLRRMGFSKDNKINQPQILIGLVVNEVGFPVYYNIFEGNTFEGKTLIPVILDIKNKYRIKNLTVMADAGMISRNNLLELKKNGVNYVVGARIGYLNLEETKEISNELKKIDGKIIRHDEMLYEYSTKRAIKDRITNDKQIKKAEYYLKHPTKILKRSKFLSSDDKRVYKLNETLIEKYRLIEGIKCYTTNIKDIDEKLLINRYKDLWKVEQAFRIAKSDIEARPIYHRRRNSIEYHILIVFIALCMCKVIEVEKQESIKRVMDDLRDKWTIVIQDTISGNSLKLLLDKKPH